MAAVIKLARTGVEQLEPELLDDLDISVHDVHHGVDEDCFPRLFVCQQVRVRVALVLKQLKTTESIVDCFLLRLYS